MLGALLLGPPALLWGAGLALLHGPIRRRVLAVIGYAFLTLAVIGPGVMAWTYLLIWWLDIEQGAFVVALEVAFFFAVAALGVFYGAAMFLALAGAILDQRLEQVFALSVSRALGHPVDVDPAEGPSFLRAILLRVVISVALLGLALIPAVGPLVCVAAEMAFTSWCLARDASRWHAGRSRSLPRRSDAIPFLTLGAATAVAGLVPLLALVLPVAFAAGAGAISARLDNEQGST